MKTYEFGNPDSDIVLLQPVDDHDIEGIENEFMTIINRFDTNFLLHRHSKVVAVDACQNSFYHLAFICEHFYLFPDEVAVLLWNFKWLA